MPSQLMNAHYLEKEFVLFCRDPCNHLHIPKSSLLENPRYIWTLQILPERFVSQYFYLGNPDASGEDPVENLYAQGT